MKKTHLISSISEGCGERDRQALPIHEATGERAARVGLIKLIKNI